MALEHRPRPPCRQGRRRGQASPLEGLRSLFSGLHAAGTHLRPLGLSVTQDHSGKVEKVLPRGDLLT